MAHDDFAGATALFDDALDLSRELGNRRGICFSLTGLALVASRQNQWARVQGFYRDALEYWYELGNAQGVAEALSGLGVAAIALGDAELGVRLLGAGSNPLSRDTDFPLAFPSSVRVGTEHARALTTGRRVLGDASFTATFTAGQAMPLADAATYARKHSPSLGAASKPVAGPLTAREEEVVALIAQGYSNRQIADRLCIGTRTVETHVGNCMSKLGLHSRAQLAVWSIEHNSATAPPS
jgi:DNA-binding CsgD family transcriptional regulator